MADSTAVAKPPPLTDTGEFDYDLPILPPDTFLVSENFISSSFKDNNNPTNNRDEVLLDDFDYDFNDLYIRTINLDGPIENSLQNSNYSESDAINIEPGPETNLNQFAPESGLNFSQFPAEPSLKGPKNIFKSTSPELRHVSGVRDLSGDQSSKDFGVMNSPSQAEFQQVYGFLNASSYPDSNGSRKGVLNRYSPECQVSGNCGSNVLADSTNLARLVISSPSSDNSSIKAGIVDQYTKLEDSANVNVLSFVLKRKKEDENLTENNVEARINKHRKLIGTSEDSKIDSSRESSEEEKKRHARLIRNRENAQLSRQRKKNYVEELEDKVKSMHSTIQVLNAKISYFKGENAALRQQLGSGPCAVPPPVAPPRPGTYPHAGMMYPWMPCTPPYVMNTRGSQVPLLPIPRLKSQQTAPAPKARKKADTKKSEVPKTKKVASVTFLGLLFFMLLFGGLVSMVNLRYGGAREAFIGRDNYVVDRIYYKHGGRVLTVNGTEYGEKFGGGSNLSSISSTCCGEKGYGGGGEQSADAFFHLGNGSQPLTAYLYVPRNEKLVKIDGNLINHSILASEKARDDPGAKAGGEFGPAVPRDLAPAIPVPDAGSNGGSQTHLRALGSGSVDRDMLKSTPADGRLHQWFHEGLGGTMLSSGMCTELFQFDISSTSSSGTIVPATTRNISADEYLNSTHLSKRRNRRILRDVPITLAGSSHNISKENAGTNSHKENLNGNNSVSSMVVSVLFDPREAGDSSGEGIMGPKSLYSIFVVVEIDRVKYVTYSCMLPFKDSVPIATN